MLPKINQGNVYIFIPLKVAKVSEMYSKKHGISAKEAMLNFYKSKVYALLEDEETKLWYEGPTYLLLGLERDLSGEKIDM